MNKSSILGYLIVFFIAVLCYLDMYLSTKTSYTFVLEFWQVLTGLGVGVGLVVLPEEIVVQMFKDIFSKYVSKGNKGRR